MYRPRIARALYFVPAAGYFLFAYDSLKKSEGSKSSFFLNLFENTALYLFVGLYAGSWRFDLTLFLPFIAVIAGAALYAEMQVIRHYGMKFPKEMRWSTLQRLSRRDLSENFVFYLLQSLTFFSIGLIAYPLMF